ncbi:MAG: hypothetical protein Ct9H300mP19_13730 [Dehalococcoidia bacterium]|nr:MAG: hypothetical protein Ct9H300mP19_13730 [Dehalococcoidia bacterium]
MILDRWSQFHHYPPNQVQNDGWERVGATAVDTRSHAIASTAAERNVPWISVSAVLDDMNVNVPKIIDRVDAGPKQRRVDIYIKHLLRYPKDFPTLRKGLNSHLT